MNVMKHFVLYLTLSILVVLFKPYIHALLLYLDIWYTYINVQLSTLFNASETAIKIQSILVLTFLPILCTGIPALIYKQIKGKVMPYFIESTWILWLIILLSKQLI